MQGKTRTCRAVYSYSLTSNGNKDVVLLWFYFTSVAERTQANISSNRRKYFNNDSKNEQKQTKRRGVGSRTKCINVKIEAYTLH